jgi:hypothetical protein
MRKHDMWRKPLYWNGVWMVRLNSCLAWSSSPGPRPIRHTPLLGLFPPLCLPHPQITRIHIYYPFGLPLMRQKNHDVLFSRHPRELADLVGREPGVDGELRVTIDDR